MRRHAAPVIGKNEMRKPVETYTRQTIRKIAEQQGVQYSTVPPHLAQLVNFKKLDKWVPRELIEKTLKCRKEVSISLRFLNNVMTYDEK